MADGNHFAISGEFVEEGIPYYRGQDVVGHFFIEQASPYRITRQAFDQDFMKRSHLRQGVVLLSIVGTIGELSLVKQQEEATCSCKLAILRPKRVSPEYLAAYLASPIGRLLTERWTRGAVQMGLLLEDMDQLVVPRWRGGLEERIKGVVDAAYDGLEEADRAAQDAEQSLLRALDLEDWQPPEPLTYTRRASDVFASGRFDAEFFAPRVLNLIEILENKFAMRTLGSLGLVTNGRTVPYNDAGHVRVIRSGDLSELTDEKEYLRTDQATGLFRLQSGDVLISSIGFGSIGKVQVFDLQGDFATVSEVTVLRQSSLNPWYLAIFLRSFAGQCQLERFVKGATGQLHLYPKDVAQIEVPVLPEKQQRQFEELARKTKAARRRAHALLERAKRAVEIAIEESEAAALRFLAEPEQ